MLIGLRGYPISIAQFNPSFSDLDSQIPMIKVNPTLALTLILLSMMVAAGVVSGSWGYALGRDALRGITQPETRPGQVGDADGESAPQSGLVIVNEQELINEVKRQINDNTPMSAAAPTSSITERPAEPVPPAIAPSPAETVSNESPAPEPEADWSEPVEEIGVDGVDSDTSAAPEEPLPFLESEPSPGEVSPLPADTFEPVGN